MNMATYLIRMFERVDIEAEGMLVAPNIGREPALNFCIWRLISASACSLTPQVGLAVRPQPPSSFELALGQLVGSLKFQLFLLQTVHPCD